MFGTSDFNKLVIFIIYLGVTAIMAKGQIMDNKKIHVIKSIDGLAYIKTHGGKVQDFNEKYAIPSSSGSVYSMPNGEVVLINITYQDNYPGFIFDDYESFKQCVDKDFFPVPSYAMRWVEIHSNEIKDFFKNDNFYLQPLEKSLKIKVPFKTVTECSDGYSKLRSFMKDPANTLTEKEPLANCYALGIARFLIEDHKFEWKMTKMYQVYNPYYYPLLSYNNRNNINVFDKLVTSFDDNSENAFKFFFWTLTKTLIN